MAEVSTRKRGTKCIKSFVLNDGSDVSRSSGEVKSVKFHFPGLDETMLMDLDALSPEMIRAAAAFGLSTSVSNTFGAADMDESDAFEAASSRWETLLNGQWSGDRETGPRTSLIIKAARRVQEDAGKTVDPAWEESFKAKLLAGDITLKSLQSRPIFAAAYETIRAEAAEARRKAAAEKAKASGDTDLEFLV